jgi:hypothetical protein
MNFLERQISGQYQRIDPEGADCAAIRSLRIDIDGERPLNVISGDLDGSTGNHNASDLIWFRVNEKIEKKETLWLTCNRPDSGLNCPVKKIRIEAPLERPTQDISVDWINPSGDKLHQVFRKTSPYFRGVTIEHFCEEDTEPLCCYDARALDYSSLRKSPLSIEGAFAEAGIEVTIKEGYSPVAHPKSIDSTWNIKELQAMQLPTSNAESHRESIWLLSAHEYVFCTVKGLRLVNAETAKIGCVVFQNATGWQTPEEKRLRLFIYVHELGHCLNLKHPWEQIGNAGYATLSWMNYPWRYSLSEQEYGTDDFWIRFNFQFSDFELLKLRHSF